MMGDRGVPTGVLLFRMKGGIDGTGVTIGRCLSRSARCGDRAFRSLSGLLMLSRLDLSLDIFSRRFCSRSTSGSR